MSHSKTLVIALGGNAITRDSEEGFIEQQFANTRRALKSVATLAAEGFNIALTHGNGPQVGNYLIRIEESRHLVPPLPLNIIVADLQGGMGYMLQQTLQNQLWSRHIQRQVITVVTQVLVDKNDPSMSNPTKFVGPAFPKDAVPKLQRERGWQMKEDVGRGWRRVVPSPHPLAVIERDIIRELVHNGIIAIACGGGGIPVIETENGQYEGVEGVIDKDLASAVLAKAIDADALYILTAVERVALNYATPEQVELSSMTLADARKWLAEGQFPSGSMGPKIEAAIQFIEQGGRECVITSTDRLLEAIQGKTGTRITA